MSYLHRLVSDAAARNPGRTAVRGPDGTATYGELDVLADALALKLRSVDVEPGDRVGLWLDKSVVTVAAMQACLRLGAAYVPIDPLSPSARANTIAADAQTRAIITDPDRAQSLERPVLALAQGEQTWRAELEHADRLPDHARPAAHDLAYILYTSGSTGSPKGVCISHLNALAFIKWAVRELDLNEDDRLSSHAPFHFDLSVLDLYGAFAVGASVSLLAESSARIPGLLVDYGHREQISVWYSVPSALMLMMQRGGLFERPDWQPRVVCFAGESFPISHLRKLRDHWTEARLFNLYGPTETNVCTYYEVTEQISPDRALPVPIGRACSGDEVWLETESGGRAEVGESGELIVDGPTVMLGYWGKPPHTGPYRTGDFARVEPDGNLLFLGRRDHMVKVRGHRVELEEIEAVLGAHDGVQDVAVVTTGEGINTELVAFIVPQGDRCPSLLALKRQCASRLPHYMIIDRVLEVHALERTRNGKVDRKALAARLTQGTSPS